MLLFAAVSQLSSPNDWTNTEDYTCNFDSRKGKCLWDIQGKSMTLADPVFLDRDASTCVT